MAQISSSPKEALTSLRPTVHDGSTIEKAIKKTIDGIQAMLNPLNMTPQEEKEKVVIKISEATQKHFELQIRTLRDAPRDPGKLREILKVKQEDCEKADDSEYIERLVTEIEMLKFVLFLVNRDRNSDSS